MGGRDRVFVCCWEEPPGAWRAGQGEAVGECSRGRKRPRPVPRQCPPCPSLAAPQPYYYAWQCLHASALACSPVGLPLGPPPPAPFCQVRRLYFTLPEALRRSQPGARAAAFRHFRHSKEVWDLTEPQEVLRWARGAAPAGLKSVAASCGPGAHAVDRAPGTHTTPSLPSRPPRGFSMLQAARVPACSHLARRPGPLAAFAIAARTVRSRPAAATAAAAACWRLACCRLQGMAVATQACAASTPARIAFTAGPIASERAWQRSPASLFASQPRPDRCPRPAHNCPGRG